jgi:hypothetical protein
MIPRGLFCYAFLSNREPFEREHFARGDGVEIESRWLRRTG